MKRPRQKKSSDAVETIGWRERVRLPEIGIGPIVAKIDTGARSAALHAENIKVTGHRVRFRVPVGGRVHHCELRLAGRRHVKSSSGHRESRVVVVTQVKIGKHLIAAEVTLTDRTDMGVPMLLGRAAIRGRFLVDPSHSFVVSARKIRSSTA